MDESVYWVLELALQPSHWGDFIALMEEMVDAAGDEPDTLNYEWNISVDHAACHVYVRYRNSTAVMHHMRSFGTRFSSRFMALAKITRMTVYGTPTSEVKHVLAPYGPAYFSPFGGFRR